MTINLSDNNPRVNYTATSGQTAFTIPFDYFDDGDISVYQNGTLKTITTHYTISGLTMTLVTGATAGDKIAITRDVPLERTTDLTSTYSASSLNSQLDKIVAQIADLDDRVSRSISLNDYEVGVSLDLPATADRLGKTIQFNSSTGALEVGPSGNELTSIASIASEITALDGISSNITTVAGAITNVNNVGGSISSVNTVATNISNINTVNTNISNVNSVAGSISDVTDVADSIDQVELVATSISNVDIVGPAISNVNTVAGNITNINTVAGISANITTVAGITSAISTVNSNAADITSVSNNMDDVNDVANVITKVTTVADNIANVNTLSSQASNIGTLAGISGSINSLGGISSDITTLAAVASDISSAATNAASAESAKNAAEAARDATLAAYDSFDDRYLGAKSTEPTLDNDNNPLVSGSLYFDTNTDTMKLYTGSSWVAAYVTGTGVIAASGGTMTGNLNFGDNVKSVYGAGSDLQIYHDGSTSIIKEAGTGDLLVQAQNFYVQNVAGTQSNIYSIDGGATGVGYAGAVKLATTSTGIDVTGTVTADGLTVDGDVLVKISSANYTEGLTLRNTANWGYGTSLSFEAITSSGGSNAEVGRIQSAWLGTGYQGFDFYTLNNNTLTRHMRLEGDGDFALYEDTGTTAKFFWDASAESLGIGTSSPISALDVRGESVVGSGTDGVKLTYSAGNSTGIIDTGFTSTGLEFRTGNSFAAKIDSSGNVGIGTTSPLQALHVNSGTGNSAAIFESTDATSQIWLKDSASSSTYQTGIACYGDNLLLNNGGERMRIDSSGNVGIGTSSPTFQSGTGLEISRSGTASLRVERTGATASSGEFFAGNGQVVVNSVSNTPLIFRTNNTDRMSIDSSGNVGIGTNSPDTALTVSGGDIKATGSLRNQMLVLARTDAANDYEWQIQGGSSGDSQYLAIVDNKGGSSTERMRIDSSGNLLVGKTSSDGDIAGCELKENGSGFFTRSDSSAIFLNRLSSDGNIAVFRKDGSTVGSIGSTGSTNEIYIANNDSVGLKFTNVDAIVPANHTGGGANRDAAIDLGYPYVRFKDLYLSGGVYLGGTGSANKLDDYESGTWTPTLTASSNPSLTIASPNTGGRYIKIGKMVYISFEVRWTAASGGSGNCAISGLPFTRKSTQQPDGDHAQFGYYGVTVPSNGLDAVATVASNTTSIGLAFTISGGATQGIPTSNLGTAGSGVGFIRGTMTYETS